MSRSKNQRASRGQYDINLRIDKSVLHEIDISPNDNAEFFLVTKLLDRCVGNISLKSVNEEKQQSSSSRYTGKSSAQTLKQLNVILDERCKSESSGGRTSPMKASSRRSMSKSPRPANRSPARPSEAASGAKTSSNEEAVAAPLSVPEHSHGTRRKLAAVAATGTPVILLQQSMEPGEDGVVKETSVPNITIKPKKAFDPSDNEAPVKSVRSPPKKTIPDKKKNVTMVQSKKKKRYPVLGNKARQRRIALSKAQIKAAVAKSTSDIAPNSKETKPEPKIGSKRSHDETEISSNADSLAATSPAARSKTRKVQKPREEPGIDVPASVDEDAVSIELESIKTPSQSGTISASDVDPISTEKDIEVDITGDNGVGTEVSSEKPVDSAYGTQSETESQASIASIALQPFKAHNTRGKQSVTSKANSGIVARRSLATTKAKADRTPQPVSINQSSKSKKTSSKVKKMPSSLSKSAPVKTSPLSKDFKKEKQPFSSQSQIQSQVPSSQPNGNLVHDHSCFLCFEDGGSMVNCSSCPKAFHTDCLIPPLDEIPSGDWICRLCAGV